MFHFKQFSIDDTHSAMKVGTDALLLGAWADVEEALTVLDIGTGCGILALMACQRSKAFIDAIEIDEIAASEALMNFNLSPWPHRLRIFPVSLQQFVIREQKLYDHILCNPPFFSNSLKNPESKRTLARHCDSLPADYLMGTLPNLLNPQGKVSIVIPVENQEEYHKLAMRNHLHLSRITTLVSREGKTPKRVLLEFALQESQLTEDSITITYKSGAYTQEYKNLTSRFHNIF